MKSIKNSIAFLVGALLILVGFEMANAQDHCEPLRQERTVVYDMFNKKNKYDGSMTHKYSNSQYDGTTTEVTVEMSMTDKKGKEQDYSLSYTLVCENNIIKMSMDRFISPEMTKKMGDEVEFVIEADDIDFPSSLSVGQTLQDGSMTADAQMSGGGMKMFSMSANIMNRTVEAKEAIETEESGSIDAYKISGEFDSKMKMGPIKVGGFKGKSITWWSIEHGLMIQSQDLDKKGKVRSTMKLKSIS